ncbi:MAG TPA: PfkB family carbohydrate kinase [Polyangiaceae bacterium]|nr:PfkB family carbohydrate kinase [Polyangiaceae bacterium]
MRRLLPCALAISGLDPSGGAGLFADLRAFEAASVWGCGAVAVLTVQSTAGLRASEPVPTAQLLLQVRELWAHQNVKAIKIGALGSLANVRGVTRWLAGLHGKVPIVIDPVLRASRGRRDAALLESAGVAALLAMLELATVVTPNAREAEALLGWRVRSLAEAERAARALVDLGARAALVKGGHLGASTGDVTDVLAVGRRFIHLRAPRVRAVPHGTGCTLASLIAGKLAAAGRAGDSEIVAAVRWAKRRLAARIAAPLRVGAGQLVMS